MEGAGTKAVFEGPQDATTRTWKLVLSYDGSDFCGWQVQPGRRTVQGDLQRVLREVLGEDILPQGSGRTDTGVHAEGQVVSVSLRSPIPPDRLQRALNRKLPGSVRVLSAEVVAPDFHARGRVAWKQYTYCIFRRRLPGSAEERICPPLLARSAWDCRWPLRVERMQAAAPDIVGPHDFRSFAARDPDRRDRKGATEEKSTVRTIFASSWSEERDLLLYRVAGSGFLHHMVRNLVGTFVEIGAGRRETASLPALLAAQDRRLAGATAPPQGLSLTRVVYQGDPEAGLYSVAQGAGA
ncbi:tRNA pseudouridine(38-40) synthase TruA [Terriglobus aquaticus]|uniref:tRNA pseudouridine synthase A n=1 Tax=Terriglobus aquaticus TaxID=940139 RepID=A0ABW9KJG0_9BACT|nr:tRNA pseudouridine(38-40) synthase TruA [Terriglobus aquaticus]